MQQEQQPIRYEVVNSTSKEIAKWEIRSGTRDGTRDATGVEKASGNSWQTASKMDVNIDLRVHGVAQDAILQDEANMQEINRLKAGSNKISIRNDLAKDKMIFSEESSRGIFEKGNVELIELKQTPETTYPRVQQYVNVENCYPRSIRSIESTFYLCAPRKEMRS